MSSRTAEREDSPLIEELRRRRDHARGGVSMPSTDPEALHSIDAEQAVLGSMLLSPEACATGLELLSRTDFYRPLHGEIFDVFRCLFDGGVVLDPISVLDEMRNRGNGKLEDGIGEYVAFTLTSQVPSASRIAHYAKIVKDKSRLRRLATIGERIVELSHASDSGDPIGQASALLAELGEQGPDGGFPQGLSQQDIMAGGLPPIRWLVQPLIPAEGITILAGDSGVYKSWTAYHLAQCVAAGARLFGEFEVTPGRVVVFDAESPDNLIRRRALKLWNGLLADWPELDGDPPVLFEPSSVRLEKPEDVQSLIRYLREHGATLCIVDPLVHSFGGDENSASDVGRFFEKVRHVQRETGCCFLFIHHSRKRNALAPNDAGQMLRGSGAIKGVLDCHIFLRRLPGGRILIEHEKGRQAQEVENFLIEISDLDEQSTVVRYAGQAEEAPEKFELASVFVRRALADAGGSLSRKEIVAQARGEKLPERTIGRVLADGKSAGWLAKVRRGMEVLYELTGSLMEEG